MKAKGYTRHRFWGEYSAHIALLFDSREDAELAIEPLNKGIEFGDFFNAGGGRSESKGWHRLDDSQGDAANALFIEVADDALEKVIERLVSFGAERKKITSLARSVDYGEEFEIEIKIEDKRQMKLL